MIWRNFFLIFVSCFLFFCAALDAKEILKIGVSQFPHHLHPLDAPMLVKNFTLGMAMRPITAFTPELKPVCLACKKLPQKQENGAFIYELRDDLFWADGTQLTSADILFTWELARDPQIALSGALFFREEIESIEVLDSFRFAIKKRKGNNFFPQDLSDFWILPAHLEKPIYQKDPKNYLKNSNYIQNPSKAGLYWGPYKITYFDPAHHKIELNQNPYWKGKKPAFKQIQLIAYKNNFAFEAALRAGLIDMSGLPSLSLETLISLKKDPEIQKNYQIQTAPSLTLELIMLNLSNPILQDKNVRKALYHAVNWEKITKKLLGDYAHYSPYFLPISFMRNQKNPQNFYDPEKTKKYLTSSGWYYHSEKNRWYKGKEFLTFTIDYPAGNPIRKKFLEQLQAEWRKKAIPVKLKPHAARFFFSKILKERKFKAMALIGWPMLPGFIPENSFSSKAIPSPSNGYAGYNYMGFENKEMDVLLSKMQKSASNRKINRIEQIKLIKDFEQLLQKERPLFPLYFKDRFYIHRPWIKNIQITGQLYPASLWIEDWSWAM